MTARAVRKAHRAPVDSRRLDGGRASRIISLNMRIGLLCESPEGLRDHDRAITAYRHVVEQQPTHREALDAAMARLFEANERWAELLDVTKRQIRLVTDRAQKSLLYFGAAPSPRPVRQGRRRHPLLRGGGADLRDLLAGAAQPARHLHPARDWVRHPDPGA